jgi:hypothetical protein
MGDIWPYGPPRYTNWTQCYDAMTELGFTKSEANIMAAIAGADGGYDLSVINDTPSTGDYSVGTWQINYYGSLYAGRVSEFGTPKQLIDGGLSKQASAAHQIWAQQGYGAWGAYRNGNYRAFLNNNLPSAPGAPHQAQLPGHEISPPTGDYSGTVNQAARRHSQIGNVFSDATRALSKIRDGNRRG